ncbi:MAG: NmrA family NAD(P)-binding protein [Pseudomonadota bacterium]
MQKIKSVLIYGATGMVGPATARVFQEAGFQVFGTTRDLDSAKSKALAETGVEMRFASFDDPDAIEAAMEGIDGVFLVTPSSLGYDDARCAKAVFDAAEAKGVKQIVYLSYLSADPDVGYEKVPKQQTEAYIRERVKTPWTIIRSVDLMENFHTRWREAVLTIGIGDPRDEDFLRQFIACKDIGGFAARALLDPDQWTNRAINIVGDEMTNPELADIFSRVMGRPVPYTKITWEDWASDYNIPPPVLEAWKWYNESRLEADLATLRRDYPDLQTMEEFMREHNWDKM